MCYFDTFQYCAMIANVVAFITSQNYGRVLLSIFIILCITFPRYHIFQRVRLLGV